MYVQETVADMKGKTLTVVNVNDDKDEVYFHAVGGEVFRMYHAQDCCETVSLSEVVGSLDDLVGAPIVEAEEVSSEGHPSPESTESHTWTFYKLGTRKGHVTLRWLGESNGYYSESVEFAKIN